MEANYNNNVQTTEQYQTNFSENRGNFRGRGRGGYKKNVKIFI